MKPCQALPFASCAIDVRATAMVDKKLGKWYSCAVAEVSIRTFFGAHIGVFRHVGNGITHADLLPHF